MNVEEYRIPVFDTFNLTKGVWGTDSTHFGLGVNGEGKRTTSGFRVQESWIPLTIGIQNPSSTDKDFNPVPWIRNPLSGIQNPRLSCDFLTLGET